MSSDRPPRGRRIRPWLLLAALLTHSVGASQPTAPGQDLRLSYRSAVDGTDQPYRLYLPSNYNAGRAWPLVIALHGTSGNENTLFDSYNEGAIKRAAEQHGVLLTSPLGRGVTEFRGLGENDVLCVLEEITRQYRVDPDRVYLTGHSMGGTGAAYLALHHPDRFAAAAPLAAAFSFPWLARNAQTVPFLWVGGATDADFYLRGVMIGVERMLKLGVPATLELLPGEGHRGPVQDFGRIFAWLARHKRPAHPRSYTFEVDTPLHGRAWWTTVERLAEPGRMALVEAAARDDNTLDLRLRNIATLAFAPDDAVFDRTKPITILVNGARIASAPLEPHQEFEITSGPTAWRAETRPAKPYSPTAYRQYPVGEAPEELDMLGTEKRLANWIADAMRAATGADLALYNAAYYRGLPIPRGTVDIVDLIQCSRPFDEPLVTVEFTGREVLAILDDNIPDPKRDIRAGVDRPGAGQLVQVSGLRYTFNPSLPSGQRIVQCTLDPSRTYRVVMESHALQRQTIRLAGMFKKLDYTTTEVPFTLALYGHAAKAGRIAAAREGRVQEVR